MHDSRRRTLRAVAVILVCVAGAGLACSSSPPTGVENVWAGQWLHSYQQYSSELGPFAVAANGDFTLGPMTVGVGANAETAYATGNIRAASGHVTATETVSGGAYGAGVSERFGGRCDSPTHCVLLLLDGHRGSITLQR